MNEKLNIIFLTKSDNCRRTQKNKEAKSGKQFVHKKKFKNESEAIKKENETEAPKLKDKMSEQENVTKIVNMRVN